MNIDEEGKYSLTKYSNKTGTRKTIKRSDHRTLFLSIDVCWKPEQIDKNERIEVFDYKNPVQFHRRIWGHILGGAHIQARMRKSGPDCNKNKTPRLML